MATFLPWEQPLGTAPMAPWLTRHLRTVVLNPQVIHWLELLLYQGVQKGKYIKRKEPKKKHRQAIGTRGVKSS